MARTSASEAILTLLGGFVVLVLSIAVQALIGAYVGITLYNWFILPVGGPALTMGQLYGVLFFVSYVRFKEPESDTDEERPESSLYKFFKSLGKGILYGLLFLGIGWVVHAIIY